jgi:hypothetical protein
VIESTKGADVPGLAGFEVIAESGKDALVNRDFALLGLAVNGGGDFVDTFRQVNN